MEERRQIVNRYVQLGLRTSVALPLAGFSRSSYYYKPKMGKRGRKPSTHTLTASGEMISNSQTVKLIESICLQPFIDYGCDRMCLELKNMGLIINKKKVYRLMKENRLLYPKKRSPQAWARERVNSSSPSPSHPFEVVEIDIKYVYIHGSRRNAYLLTALDTFTRIALAWRLEYRMKSSQVVEMVSNMMSGYIQNDLESALLRIRTDNGPQFISKMLKQAIECMPFRHEFIQPGTPQQNGHIESFHHTVSKLVTSCHEFEDLPQAKTIFQEFYQIYNNKRIMKEILGKSPVQFYTLWQKNQIGIKKINSKTKFFFKEKPGQSSGLPSEDFLVSKQINNLINQKSTPSLILSS